MLPTYRAILENNQIQWLDEEPASRQQHSPLKVLITIVGEVEETVNSPRHEKAVAILNRLAARNALADPTRERL